jgi:hypothetical protein
MMISHLQATRMKFRKVLKQRVVIVQNFGLGFGVRSFHVSKERTCLFRGRWDYEFGDRDKMRQTSAVVGGA